MRRIPGVQVSENAGNSGSPVALNIGVRGLTGRYSPRSTVLVDGIPASFAPYGQPQLSFAPISLGNIETIDVVRGAGAVRYGPQNVGGIINFRTRDVPKQAGVTGDATVRFMDYGEGGSNTQYSTYIGSRLDNGLGLAVLYSGSSGSSWRDGSDQSVNDFALKMRYELTPTSEIYGKLSYYDVKAYTPGGLTAAEYRQDPFQNTRRGDFWSGHRKGIDVGYINYISDTQEFEIRSYFNESYRQSTLATAPGDNPVEFTHSPRNYRVFGIEPRYTQRFTLDSMTHDVTVGYRYISERGNDPGTDGYVENTLTGTITGFDRYNNATDAHAVYIDDKIAIGSWRITPGIRYERIDSERENVFDSSEHFNRKNNKALPQLNIAYLMTPQLTVFTNYGKSFGPVQNTQLNQNSAANPLAPEVATTTELGLRWQGSRLSAEATVFNTDFDNQIQIERGGVADTYRNLGKTKHRGIETAIDYTFADDSALAGLNLYANYTYLHATLESGPNEGNDLPFYSRNTDTVGARYKSGAWTYNLSSTHQSRQYAKDTNVVAENAAGNDGVIPGYRVWNAQVAWKVPGKKGWDILAGVNNLTDKRYFTRETRASGAKLVGAPRTIYIQGRYAF